MYYANSFAAIQHLINELPMVWRQVVMIIFITIIIIIIIIVITDQPVRFPLTPRAISPSWGESRERESGARVLFSSPHFVDVLVVVLGWGGVGWVRVSMCMCTASKI